MSVSNSLKVLAKQLQESADDVLAKSEHNPVMFELVTNVVAGAINHLEKAAEEIESTENLVTPEVLETIAGLAQALDETNDDILVKKANLLDELLVTISTPKNAVLEARAKNEDELKHLRDKYRAQQLQDVYHERRKELDIQNRKAETQKAVKEQVKEFRPLETTLMTRHCPDHPGVGVIRIADRVYQCGLDKKIYNWETGFTTMKGNKVPGGGVENQIPDWGHREPGHAVFDTRNSLMSRYASEDSSIEKTAQILPEHKVSLQGNQLVVSVSPDTTEEQKKAIEQKLVSTYGTLYPVVFKH